MKKYRFCTAFVWVCLTVGICTGLSPEVGAFSQAGTLKGLQGMAVGISELPQELKDIGLREASVYKDVIGVLEKTGLKINTARYAIAGDPDLLVDIFGGEIIQGVITYCIDVRLDQAVVLERDKNIRSDATTWSQKFIGVAGYGTNPESVRQNVRKLVEGFVREYISVNPGIKK